MKEIDKLGWICIKDKKLLVARSKGKDTYYIPGGKREPGENDHTALIREITEELSVNLIPETIKCVRVVNAQADGKLDTLQVKITCYSADYIGTIAANAEIEEAIWISSQDQVKCSLATKLIVDWLRSEGKIN